ncbi:MAG: cupin domain-containing protein [Candidatus Paceibacterota bacterium]|nr:MAG: cupin domain-containing protein [Candidatus Paceibacterota bacterium]
MDGFHTNIEKDTLENEFFRKVLYTTSRSQLVLMTLRGGEEIGLETHPEHDQFIRIESGEGKAFLNETTYDLADGSALVIPAGTRHNIVNTGTEPMRLYTLYTPPEHPDGTIHATKAEADAAHH